MEMDVKDQAEARAQLISELLRDDIALTREEAEALFEEAQRDDPYAIRTKFGALGIALPLSEQPGNVGEIIDRAGINVLQVDAMGSRSDDEVSNIGALLVQAINAAAGFTRGGRELP
jgi:hypothetical protein